jgi:tetratricopeptide (TPR) repeat protein
MGCMLFGSAIQRKKSGYLTYPLLAAQRFIRALTGSKRTTQKQQVLLAAAHYTLAGEQNLSLPRSTLHLNTAITLLKKVQRPYQSSEWQIQLAQACFRRAEVLEQKQAFHQAFDDYQQTLNLLHALETKLQDRDYLLLARAALCMADLINHACIDAKLLTFKHPLFYVNQALAALDAIEKLHDEVSITHAYAHQIAGISLGPQDFEEAVQALETALAIALKTQCPQTATLLADIYTCLGLLYEQATQTEALMIQAADPRADYALIYFGLSLLFGPEESEADDDHFALDCLFDMIYSVLDPQSTVLPQKLSMQLVDALIQAYTCVVQKRLPNQVLLEQLRECSALDSFARHIYWLVLEVHAEQNAHQAFIPALIAPYAPLLSIVYDVDALFTEKLLDNVYYLPHSR